MKRWILALILILVLVGLGLRWPLLTTSQAGDIPQSVLFAVRRGDLVVSVTETGYLKAKNSVNLSPKFKREGTISWLVEEGKKVETGEKLVEFDASDLDTQISELENGLLQYQIELEAARAEKGIQERDNIASIEKAELALEAAKLALERYQDGDAPTAHQKLELAAEKARSEFQRATERYEQVPELLREGFLTKIDAEEERIRLREAEIEMQNAARELELHVKYTYPMDMTEKTATVKDANRELENARIKADINLKEKQARVAQEELKVQQSTNRLDTLREDRANMTISAPSPGIVHYGDPARPWYYDEIKVGETVWQGRTIITLPDLREMQVLVDVHEADIGRVTADLPVNVTIETDRGVLLLGKVATVAAVASSNEWGGDGQKSFRVEISLEPIELELRAGISARAEILVEELKDVLHVPLHAVQAEEGRHFCFVLDGVTTAEREVTIGKSNAHYVEILTGLEEGETVVLYDPRHETGARSSSEKAAEEEPESSFTGAETPVPGIE